MIFPDDALSDPDTIFADKFGNPWGAAHNWEHWESGLPELSTVGALASDPSLRKRLLQGAPVVAGKGPRLGDNTAAPGVLVSTAQSLIAHLSWESMVVGMRNELGVVATSMGYLSKSLALIGNAYTDPLDAVKAGLNIVEEVVDSEAFQSAIDALGMIPIVGWIIKVLAEVAQIVISIVQIVEAKAQEDAWKELCSRASMPAAEWDKGSDTLLAQDLMWQTRNHNLQYLVMPAYPADSASQFKGRRADENQDCLNDAWLVWAEGPGATGMGFIPGTRNIHSLFQFMVGFGGTCMDVGNFYPSAGILGANTWEQVMKGHPMSLGINADVAEEAWSAYVHAVLEFAIPTEFGGSGIMAKGWSMSPTAKFGADEHKCVKDVGGEWGMEQLGCSKHQMRFGHMADIPGDGHTGAMLSYLKTLFDYQRKPHKEEWTLQNIDPWSARPCRNLRSLKDVQRSILNSFDCMYFDDALVPAFAGTLDMPRYAAIGTPGNKGPMHALWEQNVQKMFDSGDWKHVNWADVPPHGVTKNRVREAIEQKVAAEYNGMSADEYFTTRHQWEMSLPAISGAVPPSPVPPPAPEAPVVVETSAYVEAQTAGGQVRSVRRTSPAGLAIAAGLGLLLLKGRK